jgi:hypothetical protein
MYTVLETQAPLPSPPPFLGRICFTLLFSNFVEEIIRKTWHFCYFEIKTAMQREIPCIASMHMYITTHIASSVPDLFITSYSASHRALCLFKMTIFTPLQ